MLSLLACDKPPGSAPDTSAPDTSASYEIVTQTRPDTREGYWKFHSGLRDLCAAARALMQLPPAPPMVPMPADFVTERSTYLRRGSAFLTRREEFAIDMTNPAQGCKTRIASTRVEDLVRDGVQQIARWDLDGQRTLDKPVPVPPPKRGAGDMFTERKQLGGVAMRCVPAALIPSASAVHELCVPDLPAGVPVDGSGEPVLAHLRGTYTEDPGVVLLTEAVSVSAGKPIDQSRLALSR